VDVLLNTHYSLLFILTTDLQSTMPVIMLLLQSEDFCFSIYRFSAPFSDILLYYYVITIPLY
jgi:hypothetical protein